VHKATDVILAWSEDGCASLIDRKLFDYLLFRAYPELRLEQQDEYITIVTGVGSHEPRPPEELASAEARWRGIEPPAL